MYCGNCNLNYSENVNYCPKCGGKLEYPVKTKEKVKFRHQFLIPILTVVGCFEIDALSHMIDAGVYCSYLGIGWTDFFVYFFIGTFFGAWSERLIMNFSGSEHLITFGIKKKYFEKLEEILKLLIPILEVIFIFCIVIKVFINGVSFSYVQLRPVGELIRTLAWALFSNFFEPAFEMKSFIIVIAWCHILKNISKVIRPVTKKELQDEDEKISDSEEKFINQFPANVILFVEDIIMSMKK